ncbi:AGAP007888-PA-like protein [Anopheles sinensis]|uniref:AGAP007888-PA-like protein n=1 Tax=Anopheles sinensis TaxID=74873 RepID=A0A084VP53_ANOSI|nr:AGAP007888-PA-like protein [Anopheles sinensis]
MFWLFVDSDHQLQQQQHQQEQQSAISSPSIGSTCSSEQTTLTGTNGSGSSKLPSSTSGHLPTSPAFQSVAGGAILPGDESSGEGEEKLHHHRDSNASLIAQKTRKKYPSKQHQLVTTGDKEVGNGVSVDENKFANGQQNTSVLYTTVQPKTLLASGGDDGDESSDREVSPKFVVGTKKYGRRSRPREDVNGFDRLSQSSNSDNESVAALNTSTNTDAASVNILPSVDACGGTKVQRSASQSDIHGSKRRRPHVGPGAIRLKRCASLPTHRQRPGTTATAASKVHPAQLQMDDERIDQKIYFMNLSENLRDIWDSLLVDCDPGRRHGDLLNQSQLQQVCERVGLQKTPARLAAQEVFSKLSLQPIEGISFTEFIALLESNTDLLPMGNENSEQQLGDCDDSGTLLSSASVGPAHEKSFTLAMPDWTSDIGSLAASIIIDMWEAAGIVAPAGLLNELGFDGDVIQVSDLVLALEEEHQRLIGGHLNTSSLSSTSSNVNDASLIVRASLALHKAEVNALRQAFHQLVEENKKLYADNKEVNNRAVLLAQEIDERHNSLENSTRTKIRHLEQRHHETVKELSSQLAFEREQLSHANAMLEKRIELLEGEESKLKAELCRVSDENEELRQEQENLTKEITDLLEKNIKLNRDIAELEENNRNDYPEDDDCGFARKDSEEVLDLIDRISLLQGENTGLRDKNDELNVEIEMLNAELSKIKLKRNSASDEASGAVGADTAAGQTAIKRRGDSPSKTRLSDESPRLGKFRKCSIDNDSEVDPCSGDWMELHSELGQSGRPSEEVSTVLSGCTETSASSGISSINDSSLARDEEIKALRSRVEELEQQLRTGKKEADSVDQGSTEKPSEPAVGAEVSAKEQECAKLKARCDELEASLEQMRKEYEDCEDYWQAKVNDERLLYEEEQRVSDEKFTELLKKVSEYEEQFAGNAKPEKDGRLSPIDEKDGLEQQYLELETDFEQAQLALEEKTHEVEKLLRRIREMEQMTKYPSEMLLSPSPHMETPEVEDRPASSPISYLWNQSTIQRPVRDYQNPNWRPPPTKASEINTVEECEKFPKSTAASETARDTDGGESDVSVSSDGGEANFVRIISPIQKPASANSGGESSVGTRDEYPADNVKPSVGVVAGLEQLEVSDTCSVKSVRSTHSLASTHSIQNSECAGMTVPVSAEHMKHLRLVQQQLQGEITDLTHERDCLLMELQQLKEAKPIIARAYTKTASHPNQMQKIQNLEQKNRHLQSMIKQQQQYTESVLHQIWQQQRGEINELRNRLEAQCIVISDQATRLASNDILVKDMYEENSRLMLQVKRLEHQCLRATWLNQMNQAPSSSPAPSTNHHSQGLSGIMPGLP